MDAPSRVYSFVGIYIYVYKRSQRPDCLCPPHAVFCWGYYHLSRRMHTNFYQPHSVVDTNTEQPQQQQKHTHSRLYKTIPIPRRSLAARRTRTRQSRRAYAWISPCVWAPMKICVVHIVFGFFFYRVLLLLPHPPFQFQTTATKQRLLCVCSCERVGWFSDSSLVLFCCVYVVYA